MAARLAYSTASGALDAISCARANAVGSNWSGGSTSSSTLRRKRSCALRRWPVKNMRRKVDRPTSVRSMDAPPARPTLISGMPKVALSEAYMMSHAAISPMPAPSAAPLTAAITGLAHSLMALPVSRVMRLCSRKSPAMSALGRSFKSAPAQNTLPWPVRTAQRMSSRSDISSKMATMRRRMARFRALTGGLFSVTSATPSLTSRVTVASLMRAPCWSGKRRGRAGRRWHAA
ncbi:hypothetical protein D3C71_1486270 [compost metagenome]